MATLETGTNDLLGRVEGHVAILSFNRPERRNALSDPMYDAFAKVLPEIAASTDIRVLLLTGEGEAFCAGGDVKAMNERNNDPDHTDAKQQALFLEDHQRNVTRSLRQLPQPVVAALPGAAAGAGFSIALAADLRIAAERAILTTAFARVGASGDFGASFFLPRLVGEAKAKELLFLSPRLSAREAHQLGLVNVVLPNVDFSASALLWCHDLATRAPLALRKMKENVNRSLQVDLDAALQGEAAAMITTMASADHREAAAAFVERREPIFRGNS